MHADDEEREEGDVSEESLDAVLGDETDEDEDEPAGAGEEDEFGSREDRDF